MVGGFFYLLNVIGSVCPSFSHPSPITRHPSVDSLLFTYLLLPLALINPIKPLINFDQIPQSMSLTACIHSQVPSGGKCGHSLNLLLVYTPQKAAEWRLMSW